MRPASLIRLVATALVTLGGSLPAQSVGFGGGYPFHAVALSTIHRLTNISYAIASTEHCHSPWLGVDLGRIDVALRDRSGAETTSTQFTFDEVPQSPGAESQLSGRHLLCAARGGADYLVMRRGGSAGAVVGVRAGASAAPNRTTWTRGGQRIVAGPDASARGPFLRVVGGGR
jgi:hypothetical protein